MNESKTIAGLPVYEITTKSGYTYLSIKKSIWEGDTCVVKDTLWNIIYHAKNNRISKDDVIYLLEEIAQTANGLSMAINIITK